MNIISGFPNSGQLELYDSIIDKSNSILDPIEFNTNLEIIFFIQDIRNIFIQQIDFNNTKVSKYCWLHKYSTDCIDSFSIFYYYQLYRTYYKHLFIINNNDNNNIWKDHFDDIKIHFIQHPEILNALINLKLEKDISWIKKFDVYIYEKINDHKEKIKKQMQIKIKNKTKFESNQLKIRTRIKQQRQARREKCK